jgi:hypothetical protein
MVKKPFVLLLNDAAEGQKISHFKTVKHNDRQVKIYFTDSKIILASFVGRECINFESRLRGTRESLLGFEGVITEAIRVQSNAPLLSLCH